MARSSLGRSWKDLIIGFLTVDRPIARGCVAMTVDLFGGVDGGDEIEGERGTWVGTDA